MKKIAVMKTFSGLLCGIGGAAFGWLIGYAIYFFTEVLPFRNERPEERLIHAVDGGMAIGILTFLFLMPIGAIVGSFVGVYLTTKRANKLAGEGQ